MVCIDAEAPSRGRWIRVEPSAAPHTVRRDHFENQGRALERVPDVRAAGGVIVRRSPDDVARVLLVHRPRHDDWTFPKGKLVEGESWESGALREVEEETGLRCSIDRPAGVTRYLDASGRPKEVRYWLMSPLGGSFVPNDEVDQVRWADLREADRLLTYDQDRALLRGLAY